MVDSELTHDPKILQAPEYIPVAKPKIVPSTPYPKESLYYVDAASIRLLGVWFDELKKNGVYDNTRIIIVSDHGYAIPTKMPDTLMLPNGDDLSWYRCLLMVKDFGASGSLKTDTTFMPDPLSGEVGKGYCRRTPTGHFQYDATDFHPTGHHVHLPPSWGQTVSVV